MKSFRKIAVAALAGAVCALPVPAPVHAGEIGTDIAKMVLGGLARKGVGSIFSVTMGKTELTPDDLKQILDSAFQQYELAHVADTINALSLGTALYNHHASVETRKSLVISLRQDATKTLEWLDGEINNRDRFFKLTSNYIFTKTVQLAFKAEEFVLDSGDTVHAVLAEDAAKGIADLRRYFETHFSDPAYENSLKIHGNTLHHVVPCVHWETGVHPFDTSGADFVNRDPNNPAAANKFCLDWWGEYVKHGWPGLAGVFFGQHEAIKHPHRDVWFYTYRKDVGKEEVWVGEASSEARAKAERFAKSMDQYPESLGEVSSHLRGWYEIVETLSKSASEKNRARADMEALGLK